MISKHVIYVLVVLRLISDTLFCISLWKRSTLTTRWASASCDKAWRALNKHRELSVVFGEGERFHHRHGKKVVFYNIYWNAVVFSAHSQSWEVNGIWWNMVLVSVIFGMSSWFWCQTVILISTVFTVLTMHDFKHLLRMD